jgi:hypothetical protein
VKFFVFFATRLAGGQNFRPFRLGKWLAGCPARLSGDRAGKMGDEKDFLATQVRFWIQKKAFWSPKCKTECPKAFRSTQNHIGVAKKPFRASKYGIGSLKSPFDLPNAKLGARKVFFTLQKGIWSSESLFRCPNMKLGWRKVFCPLHKRNWVLEKAF